MDELALLGGKPVRTKPFSSRPCVDEKEIDAVVKSIREGFFSRFVGSNIPGTRDLLRQTSDKLLGLNQPHSFLGGPNVRRFEADWAEFHKVKYAVAMNSATSCITAALLAMGIEPGDEVITTPLSFTATATAVVTALGVPVFADIDPESLCLDPAAVEKLITKRTKFILPVHWCGNAGTIDGIMKVAKKHGLKVIEDSCQAPGTFHNGKFLGNHGDCGVFSYSEPKNVMTGEGGMLITDNPDIAEKCRLIRNHGEAIPVTDDSDEYLKNVVGYNFRMVEAVAAIGWVQTSKLAHVNGIRNKNYKHLTTKLNSLAIPGLVPQKITNPDTYYAYTACFRWISEKAGISRDTLVLALRAEGIPVATGVGRLMSDNMLFQRRIAFGSKGFPFTENKTDYSPALLPVAHKIHDSQYLGFFLCGYPNTTDDMDDIVKSFEKIGKGIAELSEHEKKNRPAVGYDRGRGN